LRAASTFFATSLLCSTLVFTATALSPHICPAVFLAIRYILIGLSIEPLDRLTPVVAAVVGIEVAVVVNVTVGVWVGTSVGVPVGVLVGGWGVEVEVGGTGVCVLVAGIEVLVGGGAIVSGSFDAESVPEQAAVAMVRAIKINRINL
jgi:hypothetical protein